MKFVVDAQLPRQLARHLSALGHDALHTLDLPAGNRTSDPEFRLFADSDGRLLITKNADFVDSHLLSNSPQRLLLISTGNISNRDLIALVDTHLAAIVSAHGTPAFLELTANRLVVHQ